MSYTKLFANTAISEAYQKFRPTYPIEVVDRIIKYLQEKKPAPFTLAIDVGCGSGQSTRNLSPYFKKVIGFDVSDTQIEEATKNERIRNVEYRVSAAETLPADDESVDLVTAAQAAHLFHRTAFYTEVDRILKPNGCLALYGYGIVQFHNNPKGRELQRVFDEHYDDVLRRCWPDVRQHVVDLYRDIKLPYSDAERDDSLKLEITYTMSDFIGYLSSSSSVHTYMRENPHDKDLLQRVLHNFMKILGDDGKSPDETPLHISFPVFLLLGRKPGNLCR
ncbi:putative methyltransferase DDB_G0268948 isoform X2 [Ptychodera flava]|uniref:putative methyltransferase DDB_G0268948 isoform X2 n=1 Tax=Ptychodera flava TaxID=63121 RepID=UPI00396A041C